MSSETNCGFPLNSDSRLDGSNRLQRSTIELRLSTGDNTQVNLPSFFLVDRSDTGYGASHPVDECVAEARGALTALAKSSKLKPPAISWDEVVIRHDAKAKRDLLSRKKMYEKACKSRDDLEANARKDAEENCIANPIHVVQLIDTGSDKNSKPEESVQIAKRYIFGSEITIAFLIAAAGATKLKSRGRKGPHAELIPGGNFSTEESFHIEPLSPKSSEITEGQISFAPEDDDDDDDEVRSSMVISSADTLEDIAETRYLNSDIAWLIADLNTNSCKETWMNGKRVVELQSQQQIDLPTDQEVAKFLRDKNQLATATNLITFVEEPKVDAELISNSLDKLLS